MCPKLPFLCVRTLWRRKLACAAIKARPTLDNHRRLQGRVRPSSRSRELAGQAYLTKRLGEDVTSRWR